MPAPKTEAPHITADTASLPSGEVPHQVDYRDDPAFGQNVPATAAAAFSSPSEGYAPRDSHSQGLRPRDPQPQGVAYTDPDGAAQRYGDSTPEGQTVAPQPDIGERGYSLNSLDAPPNRMTPQAPELSHGLTPEGSEAVFVDPTSLSQWDVWASVLPVGEQGSQ
ncbi:MAG: hypothetical protein ACR2JC_20865 [Chloroflexota bacterium]